VRLELFIFFGSGDDKGLESRKTAGFSGWLPRRLERVSDEAAAGDAIWGLFSASAPSNWENDGGQ
jgi:hypothetical protein